MKKIFWSTVLPDIENYQLMRAEMKEYFEGKRYFNEDMYEKIAASKYEPKKNVDFKVIASPSQAPTDIIGDDINLLRERVRESLKNPRTYKGNFTDDGDQLDNNFLAICTMRRPPPTVEGSEADLIETFNEALRTQDDVNQGVKLLPKVEILKRLSNPDIICNHDSFKKLPGGVQKFMEKFPFFKELLGKTNSPPSPPSDDNFNDQEPLSGQVLSGASSDKENTMNVPSASSSSFTPLSGVSNKAVADRVLRSSTSSVQMRRNLVRSLTPTTSRGHRAKDLVSDPAVNRRMGDFMRNFSNQKRRRNSTSPEGSSQ